MTSIGTASSLARGNLVRRINNIPHLCFHPLLHVGSLPVTARYPVSFLEPEFHGKVSQRRCSIAATNTNSNSFANCHCSSTNGALCKLRFGLRSGGGRRHGIRVPKSTEDGGGEKGGGNSSSATTEESEKDPNSSDSSSSPSTSPADDVPKKDGAQLDAFKLLELSGLEKVDPEDVKLFKEKLCGYTTYWVTGQEPFGNLGQGVLLLGNLRGNREEVFAKLSNGVRELFDSKYDLFMVEEPNAEQQDPRGGPRVSFVLLRKEVSDPGATSFWQYVVAVTLFALTAGSCLELGISSQISKLPPDVLQYFSNPDSIEPPDFQLLVPFVDSALPLAYGVFGVQLFHEVGHWLAAAPRRVKLSIPYFVPNITLGSFGAITQFKSILPDRMAKFDISLAGPLAGGLLSLSMLSVGLWLSVGSEATDELVQVPSVLFRGSLLLGSATRAVLGDNAMRAAVVPIHPLVIAGWCGLTTTTFNLLPVGSLDGGRAMQAAFGKMPLRISGFFSYLLLGLGLLGGDLSLPWGLYILILQRDQEKPCLNDVTEVGTVRKVGLSLALLLALGVLLPLWDGIVEEASTSLF
uniref:Peptidase M50 domain-containing protein n=1 Tax=Physcomitrium patens TaxID=3218 RepID=A0A2K1J1M8_PHYPA|nr:probable zinc metalloprotease EGY1, chloroplastic [Physcomitrium patens]PNR35432.1 hypothetical protein PHYPA_023332 [Physcomitrium patens]|eukprot:XP_024402167.1 probable zinc metalloprotease EGY1, chloroplastic [Physcomitrella patens]